MTVPVLDFLTTITNVHFGGDWIAVGAEVLSPNDGTQISFPQFPGFGFTLNNPSAPQDAVIVGGNFVYVVKPADLTRKLPNGLIGFSIVIREGVPPPPFFQVTTFLNLSKLSKGSLQVRASNSVGLILSTYKSSFIVAGRTLNVNIGGQVTPFTASVQKTLGGPGVIDFTVTASTLAVS